MEVILLKDVEKVGKKGDVVIVRDGFGRNFLLPRALALHANRQNRQRIENEKKVIANRRVREKAAAEKTAGRISSLKVQIEMETGEEGKLFGSVTPQDIADALQAKGISLDKKQIHLSEPIRTLGVHTVILELDREVKPALQLEVIKKGDR